MKIVILTSSRYGTAAHHLPYLINSNVCKVEMVIFNKGVVASKKKHYTKKIKKILKIGILGALNGIRMRKWFNNIDQHKKIINIEETCRQAGIPFYSTPSINSAETIKLFREAGADLGISLGNGYIAQKVFTIPRYGMINIHHEILPDYQNAQSIIWQIYNMSHQTGYTIHKIDKHIDTGDILFQEYVPIEFSDTISHTIGKTSVALLESSAKGLLSVLKDFDSLHSLSKSQGKGRSYTTPTIWQFLRILRNFKTIKNAAKKRLQSS